ncbi:MAG: MFS transporter [Acidimicrobiales bacterium]
MDGRRHADVEILGRDGGCPPSAVVGQDRRDAMSTGTPADRVDRIRWGMTPFAVVVAIVAVDSLSYALVLPVLPFALQSMGGGAVAVAVIFSAFSACQFLAAPVLGRASDRWGRRRVLLGSQLGTLAGFVVLFPGPVAGPGARGPHYRRLVTRLSPQYRGPSLAGAGVRSR